MKAGPSKPLRRVSRREFIGTGVAASGVLAAGLGQSATASSYLQHGRPKGYTEFRVIEPGRRIRKIESFQKDPFTWVRVTTDEGREGHGQIASHDSTATIEVLHRRIAPQALARDAARTGKPIVRSLDSAFPGRGYAKATDPFLLGPAILVAPLLAKGARARTVHSSPRATGEATMAAWCRGRVWRKSKQRSTGCRGIGR